MLHIYSQDDANFEAAIMGTKESLEKLRNAIDRALDQGYYSFEDEVNDGNDYEVYVDLLSEENMMGLALPYSS